MSNTILVYFWGFRCKVSLVQNFSIYLFIHSLYSYKNSVKSQWRSQCNSNFYQSIKCNIFFQFSQKNYKKTNLRTNKHLWSLTFEQIQFLKANHLLHCRIWLIVPKNEFFISHFFQSRMPRVICEFDIHCYL